MDLSYSEVCHKVPTVKFTGVQNCWCVCGTVLYAVACFNDHTSAGSAAHFICTRISAQRLHHRPGIPARVFCEPNCAPFQCFRPR